MAINPRLLIEQTLSNCDIVRIEDAHDVVDALGLPETLINKVFHLLNEAHEALEIALAFLIEPRYALDNYVLEADRTVDAKTLELYQESYASDAERAIQEIIDLQEVFGIGD